MKNILFVSPTGTLDNGAEISIFELQKQLKSKGFNVVNVTQASGDKPYIEAFEKAGIKNYMLNAVKWWWEDAPGPIQGTERELYHYYREHLNKIQKIVDDEKIDLIVTNSVNMFQGALVAAIKKIPHFWIIHEFPEGEFSYYLDKLDFINEYSTEIFAVQGRLQEKLQNLIPNRKIYGFYPYTQTTNENLRKGNKTRLVSVGRLTERKNQLELIEAFHRLDDPEVELVLIGNFDKDYKEKVVNFIKENRIKNITLAGPKAQPWSMVTDKDIFIGPSKMETFGLVYVEALLHGVPSIVSSNPGHLSAYDIFGFGQFYDSGDVTQLTKLISNTLNDFDLEKQKSLSVLKDIKAIYSVENAYQEVIKLLEVNYEINNQSIRHLEKILTTNDNNSESFIAKVKYMIKNALIKMRILR